MPFGLGGILLLAVVGLVIGGFGLDDPGFWPDINFENSSVDAEEYIKDLKIQIEQNARTGIKSMVVIGVCLRRQVSEFSGIFFVKL